MNNLPLQPLVWFDGGDCYGDLEAHSPSHYYVITEEDEKQKVMYGKHYHISKEATGFATIDEAKAWAWNHYNEKMRPYVKQTTLYPAQLEECFTQQDCTTIDDKEYVSDGFVVTFRDVPEAITQGDTYADALDMAQDALSTAMEFYDEDNKPRPKPSEPQQGDVMIGLSTMQNLHKGGDCE